MRRRVTRDRGWTRRRRVLLSWCLRLRLRRSRLHVPFCIRGISRLSSSTRIGSIDLPCWCPRRSKWRTASASTSPASRRVRTAPALVLLTIPLPPLDLLQLSLSILFTRSVYAVLDTALLDLFLAQDLLRSLERLLIRFYGLLPHRQSSLVSRRTREQVNSTLTSLRSLIFSLFRRIRSIRSASSSSVNFS